MRKIFLLLFLTSLSLPTFATNIKTIRIGTGNKGAVFYPVGSALCQIFNKYYTKHKYYCEAVSTPGAKYNLDKLISNEFDLAITKPLLQYSAFLGEGIFAGKPHKDLRTIFRLHNETFTIVTRADSNIKEFNDIFGKRVNVGNIGSGSRVIFEDMLKSLGKDFNDFALTLSGNSNDLEELFCTNQIDAAVYLVGHPNRNFNKLFKKCDVKLVTLTPKQSKWFATLSEYFFTTSIKKNTYKTHDKIYSFASPTLLTVNKSLDPEIVSIFSTIFSKHSDELQGIYPIFKEMKPYDLTRFFHIAPKYVIDKSQSKEDIIALNN
jgi:uncharacterized protein